MGRRPVPFLVLAAVLALLGALPAWGQAARSVVGEDRVYEVVPGDTLYSIAHRFGLTLEHVVWVNHLPMQLEIPVGRKLLLPLRRVLPANPPRDGLVLNVPERGIYLFRHGRFQKFYPVAVGRPGFPTPRGSYRVVMKVVNPTWFPPSWAGLGEIAILPGPTNPLGDRWIGLSASRVGIHGTQSPYSIGMAISHGCIRMYPDQVHELYNLVWVGMPVRIEYETVKLGVERSSGKVFVACFPDVYRIARPYAEAVRMARQGGLMARVSLSALRGLLARADGGAAPADGSPGPLARELIEPSSVSVLLDEHPLSLEGPPIVNGPALWVPVEVARAAGLAVTLPRGRDLLQVRRDADPLEFHLRQGSPPSTVQPPPDPDHYEPLTAWSCNGRIYLPASALFQTFGIPYAWKPGDRVLRVSTVATH